MSGVHVIGAGGHAKVVISTLQAAQMAIAGVYDDSSMLWGKSVLGVPVRGGLKLLDDIGVEPAVIAIGANVVRQGLDARFSHLQWPTIVHPTAWVAPSATLEPGSVVFAGAIVQAEAYIARHVIVNTAATVDHECLLEDYVQVAPGVHLSGRVHLEEGVFLGTGAVVNPLVRIGRWAVVGSGAVVIRNLPPFVTAVGVPARIIKQKEQP